MKYVGKIVSTHGIKGELKIISNSQFKEQIFKVGSFIYFDKNKDKHLIKSYRVHKNYDMILIDDYNNINDVLKFIGFSVYKKREDINLKEDEFFYDDLIGFNVSYNNQVIGKIVDYDDNTSNIVYKIAGQNNFFIPFNGPFIDKIDFKNKIVYVVNIGGLL